MSIKYVDNNKNIYDMGGQPIIINREIKFTTLTVSGSGTDFTINVNYAEAGIDTAKIICSFIIGSAHTSNNVHNTLCNPHMVMSNDNRVVSSIHVKNNISQTSLVRLGIFYYN